MREDMAKILVERPRLGGSAKYPRTVHREPLEDRPRHEPIKNRYQVDRKALNENLAPLRRFLRGRIGRRWDDVYSEICERINRDSAVQLHIWQHLMWEVVRDPVKVEELLATGHRYYGWGRFCVDSSGLLQYLPPSPRSRRWWIQKKEAFLVEHAGRSFKQIKGIWYEIDVEPWPRIDIPVWDVLLSVRGGKYGRPVSIRELEATYGKAVFASAKRQLNTREIRELKAAIADES